MFRKRVLHLMYDTEYSQLAYKLIFHIHHILENARYRVHLSVSSRLRGLRAQAQREPMASNPWRLNGEDN